MRSYMSRIPTFIAYAGLALAGVWSFMQPQAIFPEAAFTLLAIASLIVLTYHGEKAFSGRMCLAEMAEKIPEENPQPTGGDPVSLDQYSEAEISPRSSLIAIGASGPISNDGTRVLNVDISLDGKLIPDASFVVHVAEGTSGEVVVRACVDRSTGIHLVNEGGDSWNICFMEDEDLILVASMRSETEGDAVNMAMRVLDAMRNAKTVTYSMMAGEPSVFGRENPGAVHSVN